MYCIDERQCRRLHLPLHCLRFGRKVLAVCIAWSLRRICCRYFASQGFYVVLDHQSLKGGPQDNIYDKDSFVASWVNLVKDMVADAPETNGKLLIDFINEPDG